MKSMPKYGDRVKYVGPWALMAGVTGTVVNLYPAYSGRDEDGPYKIHAAVAVRVDSKPQNWPYPNNDTFAPSIDEIEPD